MSVGRRCCARVRADQECRISTLSFFYSLKRQEPPFLGCCTAALVINCIEELEEQAPSVCVCAYREGPKATSNLHQSSGAVQFIASLSPLLLLLLQLLLLLGGGSCRRRSGSSSCCSVVSANGAEMDDNEKEEGRRRKRKKTKK